MTDASIAREWEGSRAVLRIGGVFDRDVAWALRERIARDPAAELLLDFSLVREFSDLGVALLAHALQASPRHVLVRGLRQHQLRIFRYCGFNVDELTAGDAVVRATLAAAEASSGG